MAAWRRRAIEAFPILRSDLQRPDHSPYFLFGDPRRLLHEGDGVSDEALQLVGDVAVGRGDLCLACWNRQTCEDARNVLLPPQIIEIVQGKLASGRYRDVEDVVLDAFQALEERDRADALAAELAIGDAQLARGEGVGVTSEFWDRIDRQADEIVRNGKPIKDAVKP